jgi:hypothetical protein
MFTALKNHPFAVEAFFKKSLVLTFAIPKEQLQPLIPSCLQLDLFKDQYAFIAIAMVQTQDLRPKGFPSLFGNDFFLIGYRVFVRFTTAAGKRLRGLYILKSETDKKRMQLLGNIFTHYHYTNTDIEEEIKDRTGTILSTKSGFDVQFLLPDEDPVELPHHSPFDNWKEARRFAGPLPFTFTVLEPKKVLIIEGVREHWAPRPVKIIDYHFDFLKGSPFNEAVLASAFIVENIPYSWKKGRIELWNKEENSRVF